MTRILIIAVSLFIAMVSINAQPGFLFLDFENPFLIERVLTIDTISNPNNSWQVGTPSKGILSDAYSPANVIIIDTINPYSVNDTSVFTIWHVAGDGFAEGHHGTLSGYYKIDTDTIDDYGSVEFSPNNGSLWVNLLTDTIYRPHWYSEKPVFSGQSDWTFFYIELAHMFNSIKLGDTVLFRFTFISDSIDNHRDGLMFDDIGVDDFTEGISPRNAQGFDSQLFPNPANRIITIGFDNQKNQLVDLEIVDGLGRLVFRSGGNSTSSITIDISEYTPGIYYYTLLNEDEKKGSWGKFLVE